MEKLNFLESKSYFIPILYFKAYLLSINFLKHEKSHEKLNLKQPPVKVVEF